MNEKQLVHVVAYVLLLVLLVETVVKMNGNHLMIIFIIIIYTVTVLAINHIYKDDEK